MFSEIYPGFISHSIITEKKFDVISRVAEEHEIMSDKGFFKQAMLKKQSSFQKLKKLLILIATRSIYVERFTEIVSV